MKSFNIRKNFKSRSSAGSTLIETIVVIAVFTVLMGGIAELFLIVFSGFPQQNIAIDNSDNVRTVAFRFINEIRNATVGADGSFPITKATDSEIIFYSAKGSSPVVNRIRYFILDNTLYKGVVTPTGSPLAYNLSSEVISTVQHDVVNESTPLFFYHNGDYNGDTSPLSNPVNLNDVRFVEINLIVLKQTTKNNGTFLFSTGSAIRNLKTNLGD